MKYLELEKAFKRLEQEVHDALRSEILKSNRMSKTHNQNVIKVDVFDYTELAIINDKLTFLDRDGFQYDLYCDCSLEDLVDILNKIK
jgi:hypothetical protein